MAQAMLKDAAASSPPASRPSSSPSKDWLRAIEITAGFEREPLRLMGDVIDGWAERTPDRLAILSARGDLTYRALSERIDAYARWALSVGIRPGDAVCLFVSTGPDYLAAWIGITRVGGVVALLNTRLVGPSLAHCIHIAAARIAIVSADLAPVWETALDGIDEAPEVWRQGPGERLDQALNALGPERLSPDARPKISIEDPALLIYTSGTTGLPKAARVSHRRVLNWGGWFAGLAGVTPDDRMYDCLPVYHSVGGCVATGMMLVSGASVVLAERFSARTFWEDVTRQGCTMAQYIGELCRYLVLAEPSPLERQHSLRLVCGNGLRPDIWSAFQERFAIPRMLEFYAATEGNFSLYNVEGKPGAIGRIPSFLKHRFPAAILKFDVASGLPLRGPDGLCIKAAPNEAGEAVGRIGRADQGGGHFEGYTSAAETDRKVLRDVLEPGDAWFRTGDLMRLDEAGFFHFVDRIGDTFRWKGENVATSEVAATLSAIPGVVEANVYGVDVPGYDGRAGMAALVIGEGFDREALAATLAQRLPGYAVPVFLRIGTALAVTDTFKQKKGDLVQDGFDPAQVSDPLFVRQSGQYRPIDAETFGAIKAGRLKL